MHASYFISVVGLFVFILRQDSGVLALYIISTIFCNYFVLWIL